MNCLITGASIGIGKYLAILLAEKKYNLMLTYLSNYKLCKELQDEIIGKYKVKCIIKKLDLRDEFNIKKIFDDFKDNYGSLDILINNASYSCDNLIENKTKEEFVDVLNVNLVGTFLMCKYVKEIINKNGCIINMASTDGIDTYSIYNIDYAISKSGIIQLTKSLSLIYDDLLVVGIAPNWVDTESTREMSKEYLAKELLRIRQKKLITIKEVTDRIIEVIEKRNIKSGSIIRIDGDKDE